MRVVLFLIAGSLLLYAGAADSIDAVRVLEGKWQGVANGKPGRGISTREYKWELGGKFLAARNRTVYEKETHEDHGYFSYDRANRRIVLRQFHGEGFVNEYAANDGLEFVSIRIENIAPGWRARESYRVVSRDEIVETFSLAAPGKDFEVYSETVLKRVP